MKHWFFIFIYSPRQTKSNSPCREIYIIIIISNSFFVEFKHNSPWREIFIILFILWSKLWYNSPCHRIYLVPSPVRSAKLALPREIPSFYYFILILVQAKHNSPCRREMFIKFIPSSCPFSSAQAQHSQPCHGMFHLSIVIIIPFYLLSPQLTLLWKKLLFYLFYPALRNSPCHEALIYYLSTLHTRVQLTLPWMDGWTDVSCSAPCVRIQARVRRGSCNQREVLIHIFVVIIIILFHHFFLRSNSPGRGIFIIIFLRWANNRVEWQLRGSWLLSDHIV